MHHAKIDLARLKQRCLSPIEAFFDEGQVAHTKDGPLVFVDRGAKVLGVAHLDSVFDHRKVDDFGVVHGRRTLTVVCPHLDDRLGAYLLLDLLPAMGIAIDVLLTDGEECGRSTAAWFDPPKQYHWVVEFDRRGTDVVLYQYDDAETRTILNLYGFEVGSGAFSDISFLDHLGVKCLNIGCGYQNAHSRMCHADLRTTMRQVRRFAKLYEDLHETPMPHAEYYEPLGLWSREEDDFWYSELTYDEMVQYGLITPAQDRRYATLLEGLGDDDTL